MVEIFFFKSSSSSSPERKQLSGRRRLGDIRSTRSYFLFFTKWCVSASSLRSDVTEALLSAGDVSLARSAPAGGPGVERKGLNGGGRRQQREREEDQESRSASRKQSCCSANRTVALAWRRLNQQVSVEGEKNLRLLSLKIQPCCLVLVRRLRLQHTTPTTRRTSSKAGHVTCKELHHSLRLHGTGENPITASARR